MRLQRILRRVVVTLLIWLIVILFMLLLRPDRDDHTIAPTPEVQVTSSGCLSGMYHWLDDMERWEAEYGVPEEIQYGLILQESGGQQCIRGASGATGLFQVVDYPARVQKYGNLMDPNNKASAGLEYLVRCNMAVTGGAIIWDDTNILLDTLWCYHDGLTNYRNGYKSDPARRHGSNVISAARARGRKFGAITSTQTSIPTPFISFEEQCQSRLNWLKNNNTKMKDIYTDMERAGCAFVHGVKEYISSEFCADERIDTAACLCHQKGGKHCDEI